MTIPVANIQRVAERYLRSEAATHVALMALVQVTEAAAALARALSALAGEPGPGLRIARHRAENEDGGRTICRMIRQPMDSPEVAGGAEDGIEMCRKIFDASATLGEESSAALYSRGSPVFLAPATDEIFVVLESRGVLGLSRQVRRVLRPAGEFVLFN
jgi:hypothetical protein